MTVEESKKWIDGQSYDALLSYWRFGSIGDPMFLGEVGEYYGKVMAEKRKQCNHVTASKE